MTEMKNVFAIMVIFFLVFMIVFLNAHYANKYILTVKDLINNVYVFKELLET